MSGSDMATLQTQSFCVNQRSAFTLRSASMLVDVFSVVFLSVLTVTAGAMPTKARQLQRAEFGYISAVWNVLTDGVSGG